MDPARSSSRNALLEVAGVFLRLGCIAFGGPAAHIAMMEQEVVRRRAWMTREEFLDLLGAVNLIPGPNSTEMAIFISYRRAGWRGLVLGGCCFIFPAVLIVTAVAWAYVRYGKLPQAGALLYGVKPVIIAIVLQALWNLGRTAIKTRWLSVLGLGAAAASFCGVNALIVLFGAGLVVVAARTLRARPKHNGGGLAPVVLGAVLPAAGASGAVSAAPFSVTALFLFFLKVGAVLFGSGYVLLAFLRGDLVERWHWLSENQLLDAVAVGQFTPGPLFTTATFIGYILGGLPGAVAATAGIFLPSFAFIGISGRLVPRLRRSPLAGAFLDGVIVASLALMAVVTWQLATVALVDAITVALALAAAFLLFRYRTNSAWLVIGGAAAGILKSFL